jgi:hypothetical protein
MGPVFHSFGKVYSGTVYGSDVAIKVPKRQDIDDDDLAALVEEVEIWRCAIFLPFDIAVVPAKAFSPFRSYASLLHIA